jgi:hypothetical protein
MSEVESHPKGQEVSKEEAKTTVRWRVTLGEMAVRLQGMSRQELIFGVFLVVLALHLAVLAIEGRSIFGRAANPLISLAGIVLLSGVFALFLWRGRIVRTLLAAALSLFAINKPGELTDDQVYRARIGANATLWSVPDAGHVEALQMHPHDYTARVTAFLIAALFHNM